MNMNVLTELFCDIDDFCREFEPVWKSRLTGTGTRKRIRKKSLSLSGIMTIIIFFHTSNFRTFRHFYRRYILTFFRDAFPGAVSCSRSAELMSEALIPLCCRLQTRKGGVTGISFIDSASVKVCHVRRITPHRVFSGYAERGKTSAGRFYGFKRHLIVSEHGEPLSFRLTPGNTDDRKPVPEMTRGLFGKLSGDRGYISRKLFKELSENGVQLITEIKRNMKNMLMPVTDKILLRKRPVVESVNDQLKNISQTEHTRHRSVVNFMVNLTAGLTACTRQPKKPSLSLNPIFRDQKPVSI